MAYRTIFALLAAITFTGLAGYAQAKQGLTEGELGQRIAAGLDARGGDDLPSSSHLGSPQPLVLRSVVGEGQLPSKLIIELAGLDVLVSDREHDSAPRWELRNNGDEVSTEELVRELFESEMLLKRLIHQTGFQGSFGGLVGSNASTTLAQLIAAIVAQESTRKAPRRGRQIGSGAQFRGIPIGIGNGGFSITGDDF